MKNAISFGTDGIRGNSDQHPFTKEALKALGASISRWASEKYGKNSPKVLIGYDTRLSGIRIKNELIEGLNCFNTDVIDGGILPTPAVYRLISIDESFDFGIAISASHNPFHDNGIKLFDAKKCKLSRQDEEKIEQYFDLYFSKHELLGESSDKRTEWIEASQAYIDFISSKFSQNYLSGMSIILDCANGATFEVAPQLFKRFGAAVITIGSAPSGVNINEKCGSTHPERIKDLVVRNKAVVGFAFDGDGDRVIAINNLGQIKDGDDILAILAQHPDYKNINEIVGTITTNQGFESELHRSNKNLIRTQVGDKYVAVALEEKNLSLGGETCGHIIIKDYMPTGDGIFVALKTLESIIANQNLEMKTFDKYPQVLINIAVKEKRDLSKQPYSDIIKKAQESIKDGRIVVRYSGTENLLRIMTEAQTDEFAKDIAQNLANDLAKALE
ncbi:MAG: phosphoglucosamine mutase [bacterium]